MQYASINTVYQNAKRQAAKQEQGFVSPADFNYYAPIVQQKEVDYLMSLYGLYLANKYRYFEFSKDNYQSLTQIQDDLRSLEVFDAALNKTNSSWNLPNDYMQYIDLNADNTPISIIDNSKYRNYLRSRDNSISSAYPIGKINQKTLDVQPLSTSVVNLTYYKQPQGVDSSGNKTTQLPKWSYTTVSGEAVYNPSNSINFELPKHLEPRLVDRMLSVVGIETRDQVLYQMSGNEENQSKQ